MNRFVVLVAMLLTLTAVGRSQLQRHLHFSNGSDQPSGHVILNDTELRWMVGPRILPPGAQWSFLDGTPNDTSFFTIRVRMPANYRIPPHVHTNDEYITVIFGKFHIGIGSVMDTRQAKRLSVDGFVRIPAGTPHYAWTTEETIIQIYSVGPWSHEYIQSNTHTQRGSPAEAPTVD